MQNEIENYKREKLVIFSITPFTTMRFMIVRCFTTDFTVIVCLRIILLRTFATMIYCAINRNTTFTTMLL